MKEDIDYIKQIQKEVEKRTKQAIKSDISV
jgi:hypothetical protein